MIKNIVLLLYRNILRYKAQYLPNLFGLVIAFASVVTVYVSVQYETSYDTFHLNKDRIYRVNYDETVSGMEGARHLPTVGPQIAKAMTEIYPEVESGTRVRHSKNRIVEYNNTAFFENNLFYVDPEFLDIFSFPLEQGDVNTALELPNSIILTREMSEKYFGKESPLNKDLVIDGGAIFKVSGVLKPIPKSNSITFDFLLPFEAFKVPEGYPVTLESWGWISFYNFILLSPGSDPAQLEEKLPEFARSHFDEQRAGNFKYRLQPLNDIYFGSIHNGDFPQGNYNYVLILIAIGIAILFIAAFNFINLSVVMGTIRSKELGIKKILGAENKRIVYQLGIEFILLSMTCFGLAMLIIYIGVNEISRLFSLSPNYVLSIFPEVVLIVASLALLLGLIAGIYPAIINSKFTIQHIIKGNLLSGKSSMTLRNSLISIQFIVAAGLILVSMIVYSQFNYIQNKDLGYDASKVMILKVERSVLATQYNTIDQKLKEVPGVEITGISGEILDGDQGSVPFDVKDRDDSEIFPINIYGIRPGWTETMGIEMIAGRSLIREYQPDSLEGIIINETALNILGWTPEEAIGKEAAIGLIINGKIIGVCRDFHFASLHSEMEPLALFIPRALVDNVFIKYSAPEEAAFLDRLKVKWGDISPDQPFDYAFMESNLNRLYEKDEHFSNLIYLFSIISIIISCIGLYGIVEFHVQRKLKEVGIRKVMGASVLSIFSKLSGGFMLRVLLSSIVGLGISYFIIGGWLTNFAYHITISGIYFLVATITILLIAFLTITYQVVKISSLNPLVIIRRE